eukprot:TRINITY_DN7076_c0_g2_i2.p1 TRINITY_DN7076_c0_g2~~TRINITY_DN7076_c0_g2_i2.p1  ORF type:complete len:119 (-),score=10.27 TRINITY_DN7076_c0_g2_i2:93-410(-)
MFLVNWFYGALSYLGLYNKSAKKELDKLLSSDELSKVPILILGNKIDIPGACSEDELRASLGLTTTTGKSGGKLDGIRPIEIFMASIKTRKGYGTGFKWLAQYLS